MTTIVGDLCAAAIQFRAWTPCACWPEDQAQGNAELLQQAADEIERLTECREADAEHLALEVSEREARGAEIERLIAKEASSIKLQIELNTTYEGDITELTAEIERLTAENLSLHEQVAFLQSREVCTVAHVGVETCGYCQRDEWAAKWHRVRAELAELKWPGMKGIIRPMETL